MHTRNDQRASRKSESRFHQMTAHGSATHLGARGMDADGVVKVLLAGPRPHRDGHTLDHLARVGPDVVGTDDALVVPAIQRRTPLSRWTTTRHS